MAKVSIYNASAGSGKTYQLAYKYVRDVIKSALAQTPNPTLYRNVLAVTFTNKATEEMKSRIIRQIHDLAEGGGAYRDMLKKELGATDREITDKAAIIRGYILHDYSRFTILTIDKFFQRILRAFIQELGIDIGYNLEIDTSTMIQQGAEELIKGITAGTAEAELLQKWLIELLEERIEEGEKRDVRDAILSLKGELFKEEARKSLENPISKAALKQMIESKSAAIVANLQKLGEDGCDIMAKNSLTEDNFADKSKGLAPIFKKVKLVTTIYDLPPISEIKRTNIAAQNGDYWSKKDPAIAQLGLTSLNPLLEQIIEEYDNANTVKLLRENYHSYALLADLYKSTEQLCKEQNTMLLTQTAQIIEKLISGTGAPFIYEKVGNRFSHFMIDEFQDTSQREWNNFLPLLENSIAQCGQSANPIMIVGDIKQSIYRWRGGHWRLLHEQAEADLGMSNVERITLDTNYRSLPNVINFNNFMIGAVMEMENIFINGNIDAALQNNTISQSCHKALANTIKSAYSSYIQHATEKQQQGYVEIVTHLKGDEPTVEKICDAIRRGYKPCDILILAKTNTDAKKVAQQLLEFKNTNRDAKYNFDVMTQEALIIGKAPVSRFIAAVMHLAIDSRSTLQRAIYNQYLMAKQSDRNFATPLNDKELEFLHRLRMYSPVEAFEKIVMEYDLGAEPQNVAYLQAIHDQAMNFSNKKIGDLKLFLDAWNESGAKKSLTVESSANAIEIMTIHKAKGLERKVVIIPYSNWKRGPKTSGLTKTTIWAEDLSSNSGNKFPVVYKKDVANSGFAEAYYTEQLYAHMDSLNTLYVALTRAVEELYIFAEATVTPKTNVYKLNDGVGALMVDAIALMPSNIRAIYNEPDRTTTTHCYKFGEQIDHTKISSGAAQSNNGKSTEKMLSYDSSPLNISLNMPHTKNREKFESNSAKAREMGIKMHRVFELAKSHDDIFKGTKMLLNDGLIDKEEYETLTNALESSLKDQRAAEWFNTKWDRVRKECSIITPAENGSTYRPDRVMIKDDRAIVVDYKFGEQHQKSYEKQIKTYMMLLKEMGYTKVEGYIWHIALNEIKEVALQ